ncbi:MAG: hypothetical protein QW761_02965 [Candidatus Aenigmatarchaeota archaeon]
MAKNLKDFFMRFQDEPIAILCVRYWYRGIVKEVGDSYVILGEPFAVEETGPTTDETPRFETAIPSDLMISFAAIEIACQPTWAFYGYTKNKKEAKK